MMENYIHIGFLPYRGAIHTLTYDNGKEFA
jgi:transposase, IS30 family